MPHTVNGIGTWYYGRRNEFVHHGICSFCKRPVELVSYDTRLFFTVAFIPLIPLGRKRVVDECPVCRMHNAIPLKDWVEQKEKQLISAGEAYKKNPGDRTAVEELIGAFMAFHEKAMFKKIVSGINSSWVEDARMQQFLGEAYEFFGDEEEAGKCFLRAMDREDTPSIRSCIVRVLLNQGKPEEALSYAGPVIGQEKDLSFPFLIALVQALQGKGKHEEALKLIDSYETANPSVSSDKTLKKLKKVSEKNQNTGKPVRTRIGRPGEQPVSGRAVALIIGLTILLIGGFFWGLGYYRAAHRSLYLVNGLDHAYRITVNGERRILEPYRPYKFIVKEGSIKVSVDDSALNLPEETFVIKSGAWERPFIKLFYVINPDRLALLFWEKTIYARNPVHGKMPFTFYVGKPFYTFRDIDYPFKEFPEEISIGNNRVEKTRVDIVNPLIEKVSPMALIAEHMAPDDLKTYLRQQLLFDPSNETYLSIYCNLLSEEDALEFLKGGLDRKPILIDWHRNYQEIKERMAGRVAVYEEYRARLDRDPTNTTLEYLLGRVSKYEEAQELFERAAHGNPPSGLAYGAIAYDDLMTGRFHEAQKNLQNAEKLLPDRLAFQSMENDLYLALGELDPLLKQVEKNIQNNDMDFESHVAQVALLAAMGKTNLANRVSKEYLKKLHEVLSHRDYLGAENVMASAFFMGSRDIDGFREVAINTTRYKASALMLDGKVTEAKRLMEEQEVVIDAYMELMLYLMAGQGEKQDRFVYLDAALALLRKGNDDEKTLAEILESGKGQFSTLKHMTLDSLGKAIALTAIGLRDPELKRPCFDLARKLNFRISATSLLLQRILDES